MRKLSINKLLIFIIIALITGFVIHSLRNYKIDENFTSLPLNFNPVDSSCSYDWKGTAVKVKGGFVKGKYEGLSHGESLVIRSLCPTPEITIKGSSKGTYLLRIENINPISTDINVESSAQRIIDSHTIEVTTSVMPNEEKKILITPKDNSNYFEFVMLGDNRDGYQTFSNILDKINAINPVFTVDDGDLVFGGQAHKYRLFYETVAKLRTPLYTTLGNHDIRVNGRENYTKLFGPPYYSFDYKNTHFVFLDSSRGWAEKEAIPKEQYEWLEGDLKNAQGKRILVFSHIPPVDPRTYKDKNNIPDIPEEEKPGIFERLMNDYSQYKSLNHGFPDPEEGAKFEKLMTKYKVDTVFLSHIHSYFSYVKDDVRYVISGGGGAELLTTDSYYHFLRVKVTDRDTYLEAVEMPSPTNKIQDRYLSAISLFSRAIYKEYKTVVLSITFFVLASLGYIIWNRRYRVKLKLIYIGTLVRDVIKFYVNKRRELRERLLKTSDK